MTAPTTSSAIRDIKKAILSTLSANSKTGQRKTHKFNLIGRDFQIGQLESTLGKKLSTEERNLAVRCFDELRRDGYVAPTYDDLVEPENWVSITAQGLSWLARDLCDEIDEKLERIGSNLVEMRRGMWEALERGGADSGRQAAHSARELLDQILKEGTPNELNTRKERARFLMKENRGSISKTDIEIIEASADLIEAEHKKLTSASHSREIQHSSDVRPIVQVVERALGLLLLEKT